MDHIRQYYENYDEEGRLLLQHGRVEYLTTLRYIHEYADAPGKCRILEVGAGTGRYSIALAEEGYSVTAVELVEHNLGILKEKAGALTALTAVQGNALDLSAFPDGSFDLTLVLGPMYHLFSDADRKKALAEAVRVTRPGGYIMAAYCMNEPTVIQYVFQQGNLQSCLDNDMLTEDFHCLSEPKDLFVLMRTEDIEALNSTVPVTREKIIASDGATNYMRGFIDGLDSNMFGQWMRYHFSICERGDLIGASHHTLDILRKNG